MHNDGKKRRKSEEKQGVGGRGSYACRMQRHIWTSGRMKRRGRCVGLSRYRFPEGRVSLTKSHCCVDSKFFSIASPFILPFPFKRSATEHGECKPFATKFDGHGFTAQPFLGRNRREMGLIVGRVVPRREFSPLIADEFWLNSSGYLHLILPVRNTLHRLVAVDGGSGWLDRRWAVCRCTPVCVCAQVHTRA